MNSGISGASILVTGGTGSFGHNFIRYILDNYSPKRVIIFSRDELKQHEMRMDGFDHENIRYFIGDVRDKDRLYRAFRNIDIVVHAAALKQVVACEYNPLEAVKTNIGGAENVIEAALNAGVKRVLALSTDKSVNPINLYGATKLAAEKLFIQANSYSGISGTKFSCVRYGNIINSRGSVIPKFKQQAKTGVLTITDKRMTRFLLTLYKCVQFVTQGLLTMQGGEVFVPKIPSVQIINIAKVIAPEAEIFISGIRPGEKLHEVLVSRDESRHTIEFDDRFLIEPIQQKWMGGLYEFNNAKPMKTGSKYSSDKNDIWLDDNALAEIIL
jgi:UDP-N-acetylglucosamine 4,6-dehydratase